MFKYSERSIKNLKTAHIDLIQLFMEVIKHHDCAIIEGHRGKQDQNIAYHTGKSQVKYPNSKHNSVPSRALDIFPAPYDWDNIESFKDFAVVVKGIAKELGINIKHGGDFKTLADFPHWELVD